MPYSLISLYYSIRVLVYAIPIPCKYYINVSFGSYFVKASAIFSVLGVCYTTSLLRNTILSRINISLILICFALLCNFQVLASSSAIALSIIKIGVFVLLSRSFTSFLNRLGENPRFRVSIRIGTSIGLDRSGSILDRSRPKILSEPPLPTYLLSFYYNYNL